MILWTTFFGFTVNEFVLLAAETEFRNVTCGIDNLPIDTVYEGGATIETYPWLGYLAYTTGKKRFTTVVVLVTKQIVLGTATEIDRLPKIDFRSRATVVLGRGCDGPKLKVLDYVFHPDFSKNTYSALAMIQLNLDGADPNTLRPICPPPSNLIEPEFYAMTLNDDCYRPKVGIYSMEYVDTSYCKTFYRRTGLDISTLWPTHTACARAKRGGDCVWRSGTALVVYQGRRWHLVGFGVYGPGCEAPARFMDYGMYHQWVKRSILRIGRPTITRVGDNEVILRRSLSNLQRYGACDVGEMKTELYTDHTMIRTSELGSRKVRYNMTIYANIEYSCVVFRAHNMDPTTSKSPKLRLRRWCAGPLDICSEYQTLEIDFYVEIEFIGPVTYALKAYGKEVQSLDPRLTWTYVNNRSPPPRVPTAAEIQKLVATINRPMTWYRGKSIDETYKKNPSTSSFIR